METEKEMKSVELFGIKFPGKFKKVNVVESYYQVGYQEFFDFIESRPLDNAPDDGQNIKTYRQALYNDEDDFKGGSFESLFNPQNDMTGFQNAKNQLSATKVYQSLIQKFSHLNVPKRQRSAYDGDFDYDKRWELEPFQKKVRAKAAVRIVKMYVNFQFSWFVKSEDINNYGAFVAAVINLMEKSGCLVELWLRSSGYNFMSTSRMGLSDSDSEKMTRFTKDIKLKRADEYMPIQKILKTFSSSFYRRPVFSTIAASAEFLGGQVYDSLGTPEKHSNSVWDIDSDKNEVHLNSMPSVQDQTQFVTAIVDLLGEKKE